MSLTAVSQATDLEASIAYLSSLSFRDFVYEVFGLSFMEEKGFVGGSYIDDCCARLEKHQNLIEITARDHFKSSRVYAYLMWKLLTSKTNLEVQYFSFNDKMAGYHMVKLKDLIDINFWVQYLTQAGVLIDNVKSAKTLIDYINPYGKKITITPRGIGSFARGIHCELLILDDIFKDALNKTSPTEVHNVNHRVRASLFSMVKDTGRIIVVGTPQTHQDFFFDKELEDSFTVTIKPAILSDKKQIVLWKEWMDYDALMEKKKILKPRLFNQEYMARPVYAENSFIKPEALNAVIDPNLKPVHSYRGQANVVGGWDLGKKSHPAHIAIFKEEQGHYTQLTSRWLEGWDYTKQLELVELLIQQYSVDVINYDATRGELDSMAEQGRLPSQLKPVSFTFKKKSAMATDLEAVIVDGRISLLDDARQTSQILAVDGDFQAVESPEGHGDSFWSCGMAVKQVLKDISVMIL